MRGRGYATGGGVEVALRQCQCMEVGLDEVVDAFPASGKALKVVSGGIACGPVYDVTYYIVPEDLPDECFIRADAAQNTAPDAEEPSGQKSL